VIDGLHEFHKRGRIFHINQIERGLGMSTNNIHKTQPEKEHLYSNDNYVDENLSSIQSIEGGGPIKKIDLNSMPRPLKIFGYFAFSIFVLMGAVAVLISFIR
jgi:hypothetical protein